MKTHVTSSFSPGHQFLEAPRWYQGRLWATDFFSKNVVRFADDGSFEAIATVEGMPSGLGFLPDGSTLVVSQEDKKVLRISPAGHVSEHADFSHIATGRGNDMVVSPTGHAYVGNIGFDLATEEPAPTHLAHIDPSGRVHQVPGELWCPNGPGFTSDGRTLLIAESWSHCIRAFSVKADGSLSDLRVWAQLPESHYPDGIAVDADGGVWYGNAIAQESENGFFRVVEGGEITDMIPVDNAWAIACAFGGPDLDVLYLMCNATNVEEWSRGQSKGVVRTATVGRAGAAFAA